MFDKLCRLTGKFTSEHKIENLENQQSPDVKSFVFLMQEQVFTRMDPKTLPLIDAILFFFAWIHRWSGLTRSEEEPLAILELYNLRLRHCQLAWKQCHLLKWKGYVGKKSKKMKHKLPRARLIEPHNILVARCPLYHNATTTAQVKFDFSARLCLLSLFFS